uniref:hypothetical protein n=1 Tax=Saccharolobus islandicus TaxID=43080 RepID=UPI001651D00A|nr:hypothetical protein [Sulfolobus islandicus]
MQISIEKINFAKIDAIPKDLLYSDVEVVTPEIIMLTLDNKLRITDYDRTIDISKLSLRYSELRMQFLGSLRDIRAVFHINVEYDGKAEIKGYTDELDFDDFEKLLERALTPANRV